MFCRSSVAQRRSPGGSWYHRRRFEVAVFRVTVLVRRLTKALLVPCVYVCLRDLNQCTLMVFQLILVHLLVFMYVTLFVAVDSINQVVRIERQPNSIQTPVDYS